MAVEKHGADCATTISKCLCRGSNTMRMASGEERVQETQLVFAKAVGKVHPVVVHGSMQGAPLALFHFIL